MKKKLVSVVLAAVMGMALLAGCGGGGTSAPAEKPAEGAETAAEETAEAVGDSALASWRDT